MGFFSRKTILQGYAKAAQINPAMEDGNYKSFIVKVSVDNLTFAASLNSEGRNELGKFVMVIDDRIKRNDFHDPLLLVEEMYGEDSSLKRNYDAERIVVSSDEQILFGWSDKN